MHRLIDENIDRIIEICEENHVKEMYLFGSINNEKFNEESDIDILVSFKMNEINFEEYTDNYFRIQFELEDILGREVDLLTERSIKNPYFKEEIEKTKQPIYRSSIEIDG